MKEEIKEFIESIDKLAKYYGRAMITLGWIWLFMSLVMIGTLISNDFRIFINELFGYGI